MATLFWTADSPYCRIALWAMAILNQDHTFKLEHLSWEELRCITAGGKLGTAATVPCLTLASGHQISDSLRIIAHLLESDFYAWFLSSDGEHYRMIEGQFSRIMYALYDGAHGEKLEKVHSQWLRALRSSELALTQTVSKRRFSSAALHVFVTFCLMLQPDWRDDIPESLADFLTQQENSLAFEKIKTLISTTHYRVPCSWTEPAR